MDTLPRGVFAYDPLICTLNEVARTIACYSVTHSVSVEEMLKALEIRDWQAEVNIILQEKEDAKTRIHLEYLAFLESETYCNACHKPVKQKDIKGLKENKSLYVMSCYSFERYCPSCYPEKEAEYIERYKQYCKYCGEVFWDYQDGYCSSCRNKFGKEIQRINSQLSRTMKLNLLSDLSLREWIAILARYENKCAYCKKVDFQEMDHVIPVSRGGGTCAENVVPSCRKCNRDKGNRLVNAPS